MADAIIDLVVNGTAKGQVYNRLAAFTDKFGSRISGSKNLENSIGRPTVTFYKTNFNLEDIMISYMR